MSFVNPLDRLKQGSSKFDFASAQTKANNSPFNFPPTKGSSSRPSDSFARRDAIPGQKSPFVTPGGSSVSRQDVKIAPWLPFSRAAQSKPQARAAASKVNKKRKNVQLGPVDLLIKAADQTDDPFWRDMLRNASEGKWPRGFRIKNGSLIYKQKKKFLEVELHNDMTPAEACDAIINFIKARTGTRSMREERQGDDFILCTNQSMTQEEDDDNENENEPGDQPPGNKGDKKASNSVWKKPRAQSGLIASFIEKKAREMHLSPSAQSDLYKFIQYGIGMKWITDASVVFEYDDPIRMSNPRLVEIKNLVMTGNRVANWSIDVVDKRRGYKMVDMIIKVADLISIVGNVVDCNKTRTTRRTC
jgi:hypothetical protein